MTTIDDPQIEQEIVERLEAMEAKDDIIFDLCERLGLDWRQVEAAVERVGAQNETHITLGQSPILVLLALVTFLGGAAAAIYSTYNLLETYMAFMELQNGDTPKALGGFIVYLVTNGEGVFWVYIISAAMIVGSLTGMRDVWAAVFAKAGWFQERE